MGKWFDTIDDLHAASDSLRRRRYGIIEVRQNGRSVSVRLRPWPKLVSLVGVLWGQWYHGHVPGDRLLLFYNQPRGHSNFLALKFAISARNTTWATARRALQVLDEIASLKSSDALLCDVANFRISPRLLAREGWQPHARSRWHRNYIKRFDRERVMRVKSLRTEEMHAVMA